MKPLYCSSWNLQQAQKNFEAQIHNKIQEADQLRASFNAELQKNRRYEEELRELREQQVQSQAKIKSLESRASQLKESNSHTQELLRQIEVPGVGYLLLNIYLYIN